MSRIITRVVYCGDEINKLWKEPMPIENLIEIAETIKRGWLPQDYYCHADPYKEYDEGRYETEKLHAGMSQIIDILNNIKNEQR